jgi:large subunit ribosomal protein L6
MTAQVTNTKAEPKGAAPAIEGLRLSRVGKRPVELPKGVSAAITQNKIEIKGPKGQLSRPLPPNVDVKIDAGKVSVQPTIGGRDGARFQGLTRALIQSMATGAGAGYTRTLQLVGTGYRAEVKGTVLNLLLGFSHPIAFPIPAGIKAEVPPDSKGTLIVLAGADNEKMGQTAAKIRGFRPPEPYGGKGVRYLGEKVREKAGKAGKGGK